MLKSPRGKRAGALDSTQRSIMLLKVAGVDTTVDEVIRSRPRLIIVCCSRSLPRIEERIHSGVELMVDSPEGEREGLYGRYFRETNDQK